MRKYPFIIALFLALCSKASAQTFPGTTPGTDIGGSLAGGYEPSGLAYNATTGKLWTCADGGTLTRMNTDGTSLTNWSITGSPDLEGLAIADESSNFIYLGVENPDGIIEYNFNTSTIVRTFDLTTWMTGLANQGLEALEFVPIAGHPEGGLFYAGLQETGEIFIFSLPIVSSAVSTTVTFVDSFQPVAGRADIAGLFYQANGNVLWAIFDGTDKIRAMRPDGTLVREFDLPGSAQEGVAIVGTDLYIAEDATKEIFKYASFEEVLPLTITPIIKTDMPAGTYDFPIAPVMNAGHTRSDLCYYHSEHTANTTGDSNIALCSSTYKWTLSTAGSTQHASIQVYYLELAAGGDPSIATPTGVAVDGIPWYSMNCGAMDPGSYCYGNVESPSLGFNTIYIAMLNTAIPDPDDASYPDDTITAVYGQGAQTKKYCASGAYDKDTGALTCTDNFLLYGYTSGDRILIQHELINSGLPTWTTISSKTDKDGVMVATGLSVSDITSGVYIFTHVDPYMVNRPAWSFPDNIYTYTNADDRDQSTGVIPTATWDKWVAAPLLNTTCAGSTCATTGGTREEDYSLVIHDDVNGISSSPLTGTYTDSTWTGAREIYIDATSGTDCANCLTAVCASSCTSGSPCQTWACGVSQLGRTTGAAILYVDRGETYNLTADVNFVSGDTDQKWINGSGYGSGADPIIETSPSGTDYGGLGGTTSHLRMNDIRIQRTGACSGGCSYTAAPVVHESVIFRSTFEAGGGQGTLNLEGNNLAFLDNTIDVAGLGMQYALFSMGGDGITAYSTRNRAYVGLNLQANNSSDAIMRIRAHATLAAYIHSEIVTDATSQIFAPLRIAQDNYPAYQQQVSTNFLKRGAGTTGGAHCLNTSVQSGGRTNWLLIDGNECVVHSGDLTQNFFDSGGNGMGHVAVRNNVSINTLRFVDMATGADLHLEGNSSYTPSTGSTYLLDVSGSSGYSNVWILNNIASAPSSGSSSRCVLNDGANANVARTHIHKSMFNYLSFSNAIRIASTNYTPASYETARAGLDVIGGSGGSAVDPKYAAPTTFDLRLCTGTNSPVSGCTLSPAIDAGFAYAGLHGSFDGTDRPSGAGYDIGAFEMDSTTGKCCECDGTCTDSVTQATCDGLGGTFTAAGTCSGACETGACCTSIEGNCSVITDACCAATWLTGDVCTDCTGKCCQSDGTCSVVSQTTCAAFTNETFEWGGTCGTCATVACCNGVSCSDLTEFACTALGRTSAGVGTSCGVGSPCAGPTSGSCCEIDGTCMVTTEAACDLITDAIWSDGGDCDPNVCAPAWACCEDDGGCTNITDAACTAIAGNWQTGVSCFGNLCTIGACCDVDTACTETIQTDCTADEWFIDSLCSDPTCDVGTCCECDNTCTDTISASCLAPGVIFTAGATCAVEDCTWTLGACCIGGVCGASTSACCTQFEGTYYGDGSSCGPTTCSSITKFLLLGVKQ